jgi:hypothetical protein
MVEEMVSVLDTADARDSVVYIGEPSSVSMSMVDVVERAELIRLSTISKSLDAAEV